MGYISTIHRDFWERFDELDPQEWFEVAVAGKGVNHNYLTAPAAPGNTLTLYGLFSGTAFSFVSPASTSPVQLGIEQGDKVLLVDFAHLGTNGGIVFTINSVTASTVVLFDTLNAESGVITYEYFIWRRTA